MFKNAPWYMIALLVVVIAGFWKSYFAVPPGEVLPSLHAHGIPMLLWLGMLIVQPWLIRSGRKSWHRAIGKTSYILFPIVAVTATYIVFQDLGRNYEDPFSADALGAFFSGFAHVAILAIFYGLAIYNRRNLQLHARYMLSTALPLVTPGFFRVLLFWIGSDDVPIPDFFMTMVIVGIIPLLLIGSDRLKGKIYPPFVYLAVAWAINLAGVKLMPYVDWWHSFAAWSLELNI
jgi:uncharacterized membrane protein YozB (DUF420 family)